MSNLTGFVKRLRDIMRNDAGINGDAQRIEQIAWMLFLKVYDTKEQDWEFEDEHYMSIIPEECRWANWAHDAKDGQAMTGDELLQFVNNILFPVLKGQDYKLGEKVLIHGIRVDASTPIKQAIVQTTFADANNYMKDGVLLRQLINVIDELDLGDYEESHAFGEIYESILKELQSAGSSGEFYTPRAVTDFMAQMIKPQLGEQMADFACGTGGFLTSWLKELQKQVDNTAGEAAYSNSIYGIEKKQFPYILCITNMLLHNLDVPRVYHANSLLHNVLDYTDADRFDVILMNPPYGGSEKSDVKSHFPADLASSETADLFMSVIMYRLKRNGRAAVILPDGFMFGTDNAKLAIKKKLLGEFNLHTVIRLPGSVFAPYTSITTNILFFDKTKSTEETWFYRMDMPEGYKHFSKTKPMKLEHFAKVCEWWDNRQELEADGFAKAKRFSAKQLTEELGYNLDQCGYPHEEEEVLNPFDLIARYEEERASLNADIDRVLEDIKTILGGDKVQLLKRYNNACGRLAEVSANFPPNMQKSLLQYAIEGKLVEQREEEGTAEELIETIKVEDTLEGRRVKKKNINEYGEEDFPFEIPATWKWEKLGNICLIARGGSPRPIKAYLTNDKDGINWIKIGDTEKNSKYICHTAEKITIEGSKKSRLVHAGDFLLTNSMSFGRPYILKIDGCIHDGWLVISQKKKILNENFLYYLLSSSFAYNQFASKVSGAVVKNLNSDKVANSFIPLPPLAEQHRIVARLEELLPLCERLKK